MLKQIGCPPKFVQMVIRLRKNQHGQIRLSGDPSEPFSISNGVKQDCVHAPILLSILFSMVLEQTTKDLDKEGGV